ncbi:serine/threonine-protein kinase [Trichocoleus sp. FACHB-262]|uniref:serine/threonine-protein kinase n=1 Tax=Trichocoleus sp. FACHB-262 TaxID=2692869 RepID=UPI0016871A25|nr:serine/threonine-protein kinase [Trichocoleus sp. FACHB-262]MBD2123768.1 serine/threonine protein kinase [Trichocoleus sp. FACHB-262]
MKIPPSLNWKSTGKTIGQGGQASVVEVTDENKEFAGTFALKGLSKGKPKQAYERFAREIGAIKKLQHPSIVQIVDHSNPADEFQFYVMEFMEGAKSLKQILSGGKNPYYADAQRSLQLFIQLLEAIYAWSEVGIIHRDLSLGNVLVLSDGAIKVIDFGICQFDDHETITLIDEGVGTPNYMAPECESGAFGEVSVASDLYSAGKILWSIVTNMNAFSRESPVFGKKSIPNLLPDAPESWHLQHIFEKTIRQNPQDRCKNAKEALNLARRVKFLILSGYPPLELIDKNCPVCGFGALGIGRGLHAVFGNPNPPGINSCQCDYCGFCFAVNHDLRAKNLQRKQQLS